MLMLSLRRSCEVGVSGRREERGAAAGRCLSVVRPIPTCEDDSVRVSAAVL